MTFAAGEETGSTGIWPREERARQIRLAIASLLLILCGATAFMVDMQVRAFFDKKSPEKATAAKSDRLPKEKSGWKIPGDVRGFLNLCEVFAHGLGVAMIGLTVYVLDPATRRYVPRILLCAYLGGIIAVSIKLIVARMRPDDFNGEGDVTATFVGWWPGFSSPRAEQSFPSGHAATAAALAAALAWRYPHGAWLFALLAALAAMQRMAEGAHFLSDVLIGGGIGLAFAAMWLPDGWLAWPLRPLELLGTSAAIEPGESTASSR